MDMWSVISIVGNVVIIILCLLITAVFAGCWLLIAVYFVNRRSRIIRRSAQDFIDRYYESLQESLLTHLDRERDNARE